jgi:putative aldouronate transport system permease protein
MNQAIQNQKNKIKSSDAVFNAGIDLLLIICLLIVALPLIYITSASFSSPSAVVSGKVWLLPVDFSLEGYKAVFKNSKILTGYGNTIFYTVVGTAVNVVFTVMAAYPISRKDMPGRNIFAFMFTFTMVFSGGLIPTYLLHMKLGTLNTRWMMILPTVIGVWNLMLARNYFQNSVSPELLEAAQIDGCNDIQYLIKVLLPLSKPILAVLVLFYAVEHWNAFFNAFIYLNDQKLMPLQVILREILVANQVDPSSILDPETMAAKEGLSDLLKYSTILVANVPIWCLYPFVQKYFVKGVMVGAVKG